MLDPGMGWQLGECLSKELWRLLHCIGDNLVLNSKRLTLRIEHERLGTAGIDRATEETLVGSVKAHRSALGGLA